jgi:replicative DNA helicase
VYEEPQPPESGQFETPLLAAMFYMRGAQIQAIAAQLRARDFRYPMHQEMYSLILSESRKTPMDWPPSIFDVVDRLSIGKRGYAIHARENVANMLKVYGPMTATDVELCVDMIRECAGKRRRFNAAVKAMQLACDSEMNLAEVDSQTDRLLREARK